MEELEGITAVSVRADEVELQVMGGRVLLSADAARELGRELIHRAAIAEAEHQPSERKKSTFTCFGDD